MNIKPVRILHIVAIMNMGGLETMIMNHYRKIDRTKFQFDFLVHRTEQGVFDEEIRALGGQIFYLPKFNPFEIYKYNNALDSFFKDNSQYKIIHSHYNALSMWVLRSAKKHGIPVRIAHSHLAYPKFNYQSPIYWYARKKINKYCTFRFACSQNSGKWLFGEEYSAEVKIFKNAIPLDDFIFNNITRDKVRKKFGLENNFVIGHVGRFHASKNHNFLMQVFSKVIQQDKSARLLLIGDGNEKKHIEDLAIKLGIKENVIFLGKRTDVADIMQAMDVFVFPSKFEALPVTLVEAQASGLKVIASDNLTKETIFTDLIKFKSIDCDPIKWVNDILDKNSKFSRSNTYEQIKESGYDIKENILYLSKFYEQKIGEL